MTKIYLITSDDILFKIERNIIYRSRLIKELAKHINVKIEPILLPNITSKILKEILEWLQADDTRKKEKNDDGVSSLPIQYFISIDQPNLKEFLLAADYMQIDDLTNAICAKIASYIQGKDSEELRKIFASLDEKEPECSYVDKMFYSNLMETAQLDRDMKLSDDRIGRDPLVHLNSRE